MDYKTNVSILGAIITAILGVAFPILLQVIAHLDEKYGSTKINNYFKKERVYYLFPPILIASLVSLIFCILDLPVLSLFEKMPYIEYSAFILLLTCSVALIVAFFFLVFKVLKYYDVLKIIKYLYSKGEDNEALDILGDILVYTVRKQDEAVAKDLSGRFSRIFNEKRDKVGIEQIVEFSAILRNIVFEVAREIVYKNSNRLKEIEIYSNGSIYLLGEIDYRRIHDLTYKWIWAYLKMAAENDRDDLVMLHWKTAEQYAGTIETYFGELPINSALYNQTVVEYNKFKEFHVALGGLMLFLERYDGIRQMFLFSQSYPPRYRLLPETMTEIMEWHVLFIDPRFENFPWIASQYPFPKLSGTMADSHIKHWICKYVALLFIRQYTLGVFYSAYSPLDYPNFPSTQRILRSWINNSDYFIQLIDDIYSDRNLLEGIGFGNITDVSLAQKGMPTPPDLARHFKAKAEEEFQDIETNQEISDEKQRTFYSTSSEIIRKVMDDYEFPDSEEKGQGLTTTIISGGSVILEKNIFATDQGADTLYWDSSLANKIANDYRKSISRNFYNRKSTHYLVTPENLFKAIDRLGLNSNRDIIVCFGMDLNFYKSNNLVGLDLESKTYFGIPIITFPFAHTRSLNGCYVVKKRDLPVTIYEDVAANEPEKYKDYERIDDEKNLYALLADLNLDNFRVLKEDLEKANRERQLDKFVFADIAFKAVVKWRTDLNMVYLQPKDDFFVQGIPNELNDVKPFEEPQY